MLLIDLLLQAPAIENVSEAGFAPLKQRLERAQKFQLGPDFAVAAEELSSDLKTVVGALPHCRLPFKLTWIEVAQQHRPRFMVSGIHMPTLQSVPTRVGFLLEAVTDDLSVFDCYQFWELSNLPGLPHASHVCMTFDPKRIIHGPEDYVSPEKVRRLIDENGLVDKSLGESPEWQKATPEIRAAISNSVLPGIAPFVAPDLIIDENPRVTQMIWEIGVIDWAGESVYVLGVLALLNTLNATQSTRVANALLNKQRAKRRKPPLADHYVLTIHPRLKRYYVRSGIHQGPHGTLCATIVRGHWKVRKTGIYFWRPHTRGEGKPTDKLYKVE